MHGLPLAVWTKELSVNEDDRASAVALLASAYRSRTPVAPLSERFPTMDVDDAYLVQIDQLQSWLRDGRRLVGRKVGLTSAAMQAQLGVHQPDFGALFADGQHADGSVLEIEQFLKPRIEPEIAFVLGAPLRGPGVTPDEAGQAVAEVRASLEIIDSRIADWRITIVDTIADNASSAAFVLGTGTAWTSGSGLTDVECVMTRNDAVVGEGLGAAVLGSPLNALTWLANTLGERGVGLDAGQVVLPGSLTAAIPVRAGDHVEASFTGLGSVSVTFR